MRLAGVLQRCRRAAPHWRRGSEHQTQADDKSSA
jgi:hypothetical protein